MTDVLRLDAVTVDQSRIDRFWTRCDSSGGSDACWAFQGCRASNGYGHTLSVIRGQNRPERAHRVAFLLANGWLPQGRGRGCLIIRHRCDNPPCCNPAHLVAGSYQDNVDDCIERDRMVMPPTFHADEHPRARLTIEKVRQARAAHEAGASCAALAREFDVGETTMGHALAGRTWREAA